MADKETDQTPVPAESDPLTGVIAELKSKARAGNLTDPEIDAELAAENAERRL